MKTKIPELLAQGAVIIDVRSASEFLSGANPQSINIPMDQISESRLKNISKSTPVILCCASGMRSGMAVMMVKNLGYTQVINAGPWTNTLA